MIEQHDIQPHLMTEQQARALRFIHLCLRGHWDPPAFELACQMVGDGPAGEALDWEYLCQFALKENIAPLIYYMVRYEDIVPVSIEERLQEVYVQSVLHNTLLFSELDRLLVDFLQAGIAIILLKGAALSKTVYEDIGIRPMVDLDLLVKRGDVDQTLQLLASHHYGFPTPEMHPGAKAEHENELLVYKPGQFPMIIEVHWTLFDSPHYQYNLPMAWFWETSLPIDSAICATPAAPQAGPAVRMLGPEAQLLHLCSHILLHHSRTPGLIVYDHKLHWLHDIAEVINHYQGQIDWDLLLAKAQAFDLVLPLQHVISRVVDEWSMPLPPGVLTRLQSLPSSPAEKRIFALMTGEYQPVAQHLWDDLTTIPHWRARLWYIWRHLFPSPAYMAYRYPIRHPRLLPLYYIHRWWVGLRSLF
ncbi:MAG: hypothetical protein EXR62_06355 [Chloroflexi bacterium]|nr:hypothetical protein [Chloroflexota bacterium]